MNITELGQLSFQIIDKMAGLPGELPEDEKEIGLQVWYRSIYKTRFADLDISDLSRACQQRIELNYVIPYSLEILKIDPLSGDWYVGQLFLSLEKIGIEYWEIHATDWRTFLFVLNLVQEAVKANPEVDLVTGFEWNESLKNMEAFVLKNRDWLS